MAIDQFIARMKNKNFVKPNRYEIVLARTIGDVSRDFTFLSESTELSGQAVVTTDENRNGASFKMPYQRIYEEIPFVFLVREDMNIVKYFNDWMDDIIDPDTHEVGYYKNYVSDIGIYQLNNKDERIYGIKLIEAYPTTINALPLDNTLQNELQKLNVSLTFRKWEEI